MIGNLKKKCNTVIYAVIIAACLIHIFTLWYTTLSPDHPDIKVYEKHLNEIEFPLSFLVCVNDLVNMTGRYKRLGYSNEWGFFTGKSRYNESIYGWGGHTENGSSYGSVEG